VSFATRDRERLLRALRRHPALHLYSIGDLDDFFFEDTTFFVDDREGTPHVATLYRGGSVPTLLAVTSDDVAAMAALCRDIAPELPTRMHAHLTPGMAARLGDVFDVDPQGTHLRMAWVDRSRVLGVDASAIEWLDPSSLGEVLRFYRDAYPDHWFSPRMLETGLYVALRHDDRLACAAGVHVFSKRHGVAALGNVATRPELRGRGLARRACAALLSRLESEASLVGLNVESTNEAAIRCYASLGFEVVAPYEEAFLTRRLLETPTPGTR
jgi:ribosomal protein S18 acetylase RimI-like enzyme